MKGLRLAAVVLAAGDSTRMGEPKQLLRFGTRCLLDLACSAVALPELEKMVVVLGAGGAQIQERLWLDEAEVIQNDRWAEGMVSSVKAGLQALDQTCDWAIILPCDVALVQLETVARLCLRAAMTEETTRIVSPTWMGRSGHPILLHREVFEEVLNLPEGIGLDAVVQAYASQRERVEVDDAGVVFDIDTPEDYQLALQAFDLRSKAREDFAKRLAGIAGESS